MALKFLTQFVTCIIAIASVGLVTCNVNKDKPLTWVPGSSSSLNLDSQEASGYGNDQFRYVARGNYNKGVFCGQLLPNVKLFQSTFQGQEIILPDSKIELLTFPPGTISWVPRGTKGGGDGEKEIPHNLLICGLMPGTGEHQFACRALKDSELSIGYFMFSNQSCIFTHNKVEVAAQRFELLAINLYGILSDAAWPS